MPIYASVETSASIKKCKSAKTVILKSISAYVILMCCKNRELLEDGVEKRRNVSELKNWLALINVIIDCWLIESEVSSLVPTNANFDKHLSLMDTCHVVGTVYFLKYWPPLRFQTTASRCDFGLRNYYQCLSACRVGPVVASTTVGHIKRLWLQDDSYPQRAVTGTVRICGYFCALSPCQISYTG
jgi:hypothetical protein